VHFPHDFPDARLCPIRHGARETENVAQNLARRASFVESVQLVAYYSATGKSFGLVIFAQNAVNIFVPQDKN